MPSAYRRSPILSALYSRPLRELISSRSAERRHVAAVCFRISEGEIEFLLVRTRGGRWTFPKGGVDGDPTFAAAAAREAREEAGVRGEVEGNRFLRYRYPKRARVPGRRANEVVIDAHLLEVRRCGAPREPRRDPTWFSSGKAKRRLREGRPWRYAAELERVVDAAVVRIGRKY